ncbi:hypothetical protein [Deinococcus peraridilitoris]|uniref:hypothetical protein n=1 Tax=Deinococcus peraridilitoris TaxID=432329 RepID=UPI0012F77826|nr:hypothetical protein [Deinococcus peraridilitoris]
MLKNLLSRFVRLVIAAFTIAAAAAPAAAIPPCGGDCYSSLTMQQSWKPLR